LNRGRLAVGNGLSGRSLTRFLSIDRESEEKHESDQLHNHISPHSMMKLQQLHCLESSFEVDYGGNSRSRSHYEKSVTKQGNDIQPKMTKLPW
jgi:hypothetical protein